MAAPASIEGEGDEDSSAAQPMGGGDALGDWPVLVPGGQLETLKRKKQEKEEAAKKKKEDRKEKRIKAREVHPTLIFELNGLAALCFLPR